MITCSLSGTLFASFAPSGAHGTAADHARLRLGHGVGALSGRVAHVAQLLAHVDALTAAGQQDVAVGADAAVAAVRVDALAHAADGRVLGALVHVDAHGVGVVDDVAVVARAHETAERVGAAPVLAQVVHFVALVDIFQHHLQVDGKITNSSFVVTRC